MTVDDAMAMDNRKSLAKGMVGKAWPNWCEVGIIEVTSGKLTAIDFGVMAASSGVTVDVAPGPYRVQGRIMSFEGSLGICAARGLPEPVADAVRGDMLGKVAVDVAKIAIADITEAAQGLTRDDMRAIAPQTRRFRKTYGAVVTLDLPSKLVRLSCIASGFGDGKYPAFALMHNGEAVGMEVEFVKDGHVFDRDVTNLADLKRKLDALDDMLRRPNSP